MLNSQLPKACKCHREGHQWWRQSVQANPTRSLAHWSLINHYIIIIIINISRFIQLIWDSLLAPTKQLPKVVCVCALCCCINKQLLHVEVSRQTAPCFCFLLAPFTSMFDSFVGLNFIQINLGQSKVITCEQKQISFMHQASSSIPVNGPFYHVDFYWLPVWPCLDSLINLSTATFRKRKTHLGLPDFKELVPVRSILRRTHLVWQSNNTIWSTIS